MQWGDFPFVVSLACISPHALFSCFVRAPVLCCGSPRAPAFSCSFRVLDGHRTIPVEWGPTTYSASSAAIPPGLRTLEGMDVKPRKRGSAPRGKPELPAVPFVPDVVWVGLNDAVAAAETILARAKDDDRKSAIWRLQGKAQPAVGRLYKIGNPAARVRTRAFSKRDDGEYSTHICHASCLFSLSLVLFPFLLLLLSSFTHLPRLPTICTASALRIPQDGAPGSAMAMLEGLDGEDMVMGNLVGTGHGNLVGLGSDGPRETKCVDLGTFLRVMLIEYREEQANRRAAIRLMFDTAVGAIVAARDETDGVRPGETLRDEAQVRRAKREARRWEGGFGEGAFTGISVDFPQVFVILRNVNDMISVEDAAALYRDAYEIGRGGVNYDSFMAAAEARQLFSSCLRLPAAHGSNKLKALSKSQAAQLVRRVAPVVCGLPCAPPCLLVVAHIRVCLFFCFYFCSAGCVCVSHSLTSYAQCTVAVQAAVVQKHYRTLDIDVLPLLGSNTALPTSWLTRIRRALFKVEMEIADSGHGLKTDGRRSLVAFRRLLDLLGWIRLCNREIRGEDNDNLSVVRVDKELTSLEGVLRRDVAGLNASFSEAEIITVVRDAIAAMGMFTDVMWRWNARVRPGVSPLPCAVCAVCFFCFFFFFFFCFLPASAGGKTSEETAMLERQGSTRAIAAVVSSAKPQAGSAWSFLQELCQVVCVVRIQRTFRARFRSDMGVPWSIRRLMRPGYRPLSGPRTSDMLAPSVGGPPREKTLDSVLSSINQMYLDKLRADAVDIMRQNRRPPLSDFVYDFYLHKTGLREMAEVHLHDFFTNVRRFIAVHSRVRLFANFCGITSAVADPHLAEEKTLAMPEAFEFYLKLLHRLQAKGARGRRMSTNFLFPRQAPGAPADDLVMWVESGLARQVVERAMSALNDPNGTCVYVCVRVCLCAWMYACVVALGVGLRWEWGCVGCS